MNPRNGRRIPQCLVSSFPTIGLSEISRGGVRIVYRALDLKLDREVALKVLPPELVADPERKRRFVQEAMAAAKLEHPHIAVVYEIDEAGEHLEVLIRGEIRDAAPYGNYHGSKVMLGHFVDYWGAGDIDRERVEEALSKIKR